MGNYVSRHAEYSTKEVIQCETPEPNCEARSHRILKLDPRSPTAEIVRTPIQVDDKFGTPKNSWVKPDPCDTPTSILSTIAMRSSEADLRSLCDLSTYKEQCNDDFEEMMADLAEIEESYKQPKEAKIVKELMKSQEKKVDPKLVPCQKLRFSPERDSVSKPPATKPRTPLGVRSSNTTAVMDSPSAVLRMKQQRWVQEGVHLKLQAKQHHSFNCENTPPKAMTKAATLPRKRQIIEWDKDTTMII